MCSPEERHNIQQSPIYPHAIVRKAHRRYVCWQWSQEPPGRPLNDKFLDEIDDFLIAHSLQDLLAISVAVHTPGADTIFAEHLREDGDGTVYILEIVNNDRQNDQKIETGWIFSRAEDGSPVVRPTEKCEDQHGRHDIKTN